LYIFGVDYWDSKNVDIAFLNGCVINIALNREKNSCMKLLKTNKETDRVLLRVALISFVTLFLELLVIRLISTEIRIFAYLSNLVLLATFVGSGLGMVGKRKLPLWVTPMVIMIISLLLTIRYIVRLPNLEFNFVSGITELLSPLSESYVWLQLDTFSKTGILIGLVLTVLLFGLVVLAFFPLGEYLGELFNKSKKPLLTYSVNIVASLLGMWAFSLLSFWGFSPYLGLFLCLLMLFPLISKEMPRLYWLVAVVTVAVVLLPRSAKQPYEAPVTFWSPYQKLTLSLIQKGKPQHADGWFLEVNNVGYMGLLDLSTKNTESRMPILTEHFKDVDEALMGNQYDFPYRLKPTPQQVLIIGGGAGNDASAAIRANAQKVDLVEIDPRIVAIGRKYHPEQPYSDPRINVMVNDGRAFLESTKKKYDLIVMGLADSHTSSSSLTNVQLDNYLYTYESLRTAWRILKDDGLLVLTFEVPRPWVGQRLEQTVTAAFGHEPTVFEVRSDGAFGWGGIFFVVSKNQDALSKIMLSKPDVASFVSKNLKTYPQTKTNLLTDDWPYLYLDTKRIPILHLIVAVMISALIFVSRSKVVGIKKIDWPFFALGAGFMVYEFQNISKASLLFGNTWMTNMFIITGVLMLILAANFAVSKKWLTLQQTIYLLFGSIALQLLVPYSIFNQFTGMTKFVFSILFLNLPHLFSGILFAQLFTKHKDKSVAFGSNLLGSAIGGFFEVFSYLFGMSGLIWITLGLYGLGVVKYLKKK
jgi:spermidine synthase